ncbi:MAG: DinB family protein [Cyclobacteriaceae bacterium]
MNKKIFLIAGLLTGSFAFAQAQTEISFENDFAQDFYPVWQRAGAYMLETAEAMPEELYSYQPSEDIFTFAEQLMHVAANLHFLNASYVSETELPEIDTDAEGKSKEEIIAILRDAIHEVDLSYQALTASEDEAEVNLFNRTPTNKRRVLMLMRDHMTHHRGQLVIYLRLNGIEPPRYVGW